MFIFTETNKASKISDKLFTKLTVNKIFFINFRTKKFNNKFKINSFSNKINTLIFFFCDYFKLFKKYNVKKEV